MNYLAGCREVVHYGEFLRAPGALGGSNALLGFTQHATQNGRGEINLDAAVRL